MNNLQLLCLENLQPLQNHFVMDVFLLQLRPQAAAATSDVHGYFAATYRISQFPLVAAHNSPNESTKATGVRLDSQESAQHRAVDERAQNVKDIKQVTTKNPQ